MIFSPQYTTYAIVYVKAEKYESVIVDFLHECVGSVPLDHGALRIQITVLNEERNDQQVSNWRRLKAKLGYDPDHALDELIRSWFEFMHTFGSSGVDEAIVSVQGESTAEILEKETAITRNSEIDCDLNHAMKAASPTLIDKEDTPVWKSPER